MSDAENRLKRLKIRSWRRGTKEMDLFFGLYADANLENMTAQDLDAYEALLAEEDPVITNWALGLETPPDRHSVLLEKMMSHIKSIQV